MYFPLFVGVLCLSLLCYAVLCVRSRFCDHLEEEEKSGCFAILYYRCTVTINVLWLFLTLSRVGLQCVIVIFPDYTHFLYRCT